MLEYIFDLIAPHLCIVCQKEGAILCATCAEALPEAPPRCYICVRKAARGVCRQCAATTPLDGIVAATAYSAEAKSLVRRLKFERAAAAARAMASLMAHQLDSVPKAASPIVTYAPTATKRVRIRGYDQSRLIARHLARELGTAYHPLLLRSGQTRQVGMDKQRRKEQMQQVFSLRSHSSIDSRHIILVDDVLTTGATLEAAGRVLKQAGASTITAVVVAVA